MDHHLITLNPGIDYENPDADFISVLADQIELAETLAGGVLFVETGEDLKGTERLNALRRCFRSAAAELTERNDDECEIQISTVATVQDMGETYLQFQVGCHVRAS